MEATPKFCVSCGAKLTDNATFCAACGVKVASGATQPASQNVQTVPPRDTANEALVKRRPVLGVLLILAGVAIVIAVIAAACAQI